VALLVGLSEEVWVTVAVVVGVPVDVTLSVGVES
jgi:hypothetical protein